MRINLKTVGNKTFTADAEPTETIAELKSKIEKQGEYSATGMKIIFGGKILEDVLTIGETGINESHKNIVVVAKKLTQVKKKEEPVNPPPQQTSSSQPVQQQTTTTTPTTNPTPTTTTEVPQQTTTTTPTQPPQQTTPEPPSALVSQFLEMGFERANIEECARAADNDPERTAEFLMTGIPDYIRQNVLNAPQRQTQPQQPQQQQQQQTTVPTQQSGGDMGGLAQLIQQFPQFNQLRAAIQSNPHLLTPIMQRLAQSNPELVEVINQNPEEFIRLLNEPVQTAPQQQQQGAFGGFGGMGGGMPQMGRQPPGTIMVTPQEKDAIDRLVGMGFDRVLAVQAYFACGKDENLAANFLLENPEMLDMGGDDDDDLNPDQGENDDNMRDQ